GSCRWNLAVEAVAVAFSEVFSARGEPGVPGVTVIQADTRTCIEIPGETRSPRYKRSRPRSLPVPEAPRAVLSCHPRRPAATGCVRVPAAGRSPPGDRHPGR